ncbi:MAG: response regulator [Acidobacteriota bacterium]
MIDFLKSKSRVLLLDDDPAMQRLVTSILKREGYRVDVVDKGQDAIKSMKERRYDAVLLDIMMPHEGGMTVIKHLGNEQPEALNRVLLFTGTSQSVLRTIEHKVFGVVSKPFEPADLVNAVGRVVAQSK